MINKKSKIFVAGHNGFVGRAIIKKLAELGYQNVFTQSRKKLDLLDTKKVFNYIQKKKPNCIIVAAAFTGGILFNQKKKSEVLYKNILMQNNLIEAARLNKSKDLLFLASNCIYSKAAKQPWQEKDILNGPLEETHESYSLSKIIGIKLCEYYNSEYKTNFKTLILTNIYGPGDKYNSFTSTFFAAFLKKFYHAKKNKEKKVFINSKETIKREILYVEDVALACIFFLKKKTKHLTINIGPSKEMTLKQYAEFIKKKLDLKIKIIFSNNSVGGIEKKSLNCKIANNYGWKPKFNLEKGFQLTIKDLEKNIRMYDI